MEVLMFLIIGFISGLFANQLMRGHSLGIVVDIIVGIAGSLLGGFMFSMMGMTMQGFWGAVGRAIAGAVLFLLILRLTIWPYEKNKTLK